jgi:hypothetical protein
MVPPHVQHFRCKNPVYRQCSPIGATTLKPGESQWHDRVFNLLATRSLRAAISHRRYYSTAYRSWRDHHGFEFSATRATDVEQYSLPVMITRLTSCERRQYHLTFNLFATGIRRLNETLWPVL